MKNLTLPNPNNVEGKVSILAPLDTRFFIDAGDKVEFHRMRSEPFNTLDRICFNEILSEGEFHCVFNAPQDVLSFRGIIDGALGADDSVSGSSQSLKTA